MIDLGAAAVAKELDGLPLALATAGAYLDQVATGFQDYLRLYKASWLKLQQTTPELSSYEDRQLYTLPRSVKPCWSPLFNWRAPCRPFERLAYIWLSPVYIRGPMAFGRPPP